MKAWWSETRPNGAPIDSGTFCRVIDLEDGTHPVYIYGRTVEEVLEKIERQNGNAQVALARRAAPPPANGTVAAPAAAETRFSLTTDQVMQYHADMDNPAKVGKALVMLQAHETGVDPNKVRLEKWIALGQDWEREHPEFYQIFGNRKVLGDHLGALVNGEVERITKDMMTAAYVELLAKGLLYEPEQIAPVSNVNESTPSPLPVESQVQPTERQPRRMFATSVPASSLRSSQRQPAPSRTLKYTEQQIRTMPLQESERLLRAKDADYMAACDHWFPQSQAPRRMA